MSELIKGNDFLLYAYRGDTLLPIVCQTDMELTINRDIKEATKPSNSFWRNYYYGMAGYSFSANNVFSVDASNIIVNDVLDILIEGAELEWVMRSKQNETISYSGRALVSNVQISAGVEGAITWSFQATGSGRINKTKIKDTHTVYGKGQTVYITRQNQLLY